MTKGTNMANMPRTKSNSKIRVVNTAKVFLNFNLRLRNSTIGFAIRLKINAIIKYRITV